MSFSEFLSQFALSQWESAYEIVNRFFLIHSFVDSRSRFMQFAYFGEAITSFSDIKFSFQMIDWMSSNFILFQISTTKNNPHLKILLFPLFFCPFLVFNMYEI